MLSAYRSHRIVTKGEQPISTSSEFSSNATIIFGSLKTLFILEIGYFSGLGSWLSSSRGTDTQQFDRGKNRIRVRTENFALLSAYSFCSFLLVFAFRLNSRVSYFARVGRTNILHTEERTLASLGVIFVVGYLIG